MVYFATVGTSTITEQFINHALKNKNVRLGAVYSRSQARAAEFAQRLGAPKQYTSLQLMAEDPGIDAVYIASPNSCHAAQTKLFCKAGKHVFCEKPVCSNSNELQDVLDCVRENKVLFAEAFKTCCLPNYQQIKTLLPFVGKVRSVYFDFARYSSRYDAHKRGEAVNTFRAEFSNGAAMDMGVYSIYPILDIFGAPKDILAMGTVIPDRVDGEGFALFKYDGFTACAHFSKIADSFAVSRIEGEDGSLLIDSIYAPEHVRLVLRDGAVRVWTLDKRKNSMQYEVDEFVRCVENGLLQSPVLTHQLSVLGMQVLDEIRRQLGVTYPADE